MFPKYENHWFWYWNIGNLEKSGLQKCRNYEKRIVERLDMNRDRNIFEFKKLEFLKFSKNIILLTLSKT